jgi:hypothetical protein
MPRLGGDEANGIDVDNPVMVGRCRGGVGGRICVKHDTAESTRSGGLLSNEHLSWPRNELLLGDELSCGPGTLCSLCCEKYTLEGCGCPGGGQGVPPPQRSTCTKSLASTTADKRESGIGIQKW